MCNVQIFAEISEFERTKLRVHSRPVHHLAGTLLTFYNSKVGLVYQTEHV